MAYSVSLVGVDPTAVFTPWSTSSDGYQTSTNNPPHKVGLHVQGSDDTEWVYVKAAAAITGAGYMCYYTTAFAATMLSTSNDVAGTLCGVAMAAIPQNSYGWLQVKGPASLLVNAAAAADTKLNTTATAGQLDDDATAGSFVVDRVYIGTVQGGAAGVNTTARLNFPQIASAAL